MGSAGHPLNRWKPAAALTGSGSGARLGATASSRKVAKLLRARREPGAGGTQEAAGRGVGALEPSRTVTGEGGVPEPGTDPPPDRICMIMREASRAGSRRRRGIRERTPRPSAARAARELRAASGPQAGEPPGGPFEGGRHPSRPRDPRPGHPRAGSPPRRGEALGARTRDGARVAGGCSQLLAGTRCAPSLRAAFGRHRRGPGTGPSVPARGIPGQRIGRGARGGPAPPSWLPRSCRPWPRLRSLLFIQKIILNKCL